MKSDLVEEETVLQNSGSSLRAVFLVLSLNQVLIGFRVSSSSSSWKYSSIATSLFK
jgi:hypothetical protein